MVQAEAHDHQINAKDMKDAADQLEKLKNKGSEIDEVHNYDHGNRWEQEFGKRMIGPKDPNSKQLGDSIRKGGKIGIGVVLIQKTQLRRLCHIKRYQYRKIHMGGLWGWKRIRS